MENNSQLTYGGDIKDFPIEVVEKMLYYQKEQGNKRDISVFKKNRCYNKFEGGFNWTDTKEGVSFWQYIIEEKLFDLFFKEYPKLETENKDTNQQQGIKETNGKLMTNEVDVRFYKEMCKAMTINKKKYPRGNHYKKIDKVKLLEAMERHLLEVKDVMQNSDTDRSPMHLIDEDGCNHITKIATNAMMLWVQFCNLKAPF
jgi:hypothetical protein